MSMNTQGRPTAPQALAIDAPTSGSALLPEEPLLFEIGDRDHSGVDLPDVEVSDDRLGGLRRKTPLDLPGLTEPEAMRHYVRLSRQNYSIDSGMYPLGSCTMKHNPRLNEKMARLSGFADVHLLQPVSTVQGALGAIEELARWLMELTNTEAAAMSPKAGAHGELCGMMAIRAAHAANGQGYRNIVLVPESAHGTNPATAAFLGYEVRSIDANEHGTVDVEAVKAALGDDVAAIMLTNPNTCGLFESQVIESPKRSTRRPPISTAMARTSTPSWASCGRGIWASTPCISTCTRPFRPPMAGAGRVRGRWCCPRRSRLLRRCRSCARMASGSNLSNTPRMGALAASPPFTGRWAYIRALTYMLSHGKDGLAQAARDAVLNATTSRQGSRCVLGALNGQPVMHEVLFDDTFLKGTGVTTLDFAKAMIDEGFHPMTMYFPLVVQGPC